MYEYFVKKSLTQLRSCGVDLRVYVFNFAVKGVESEHFVWSSRLVGVSRRSQLKTATTREQIRKQKGETAALSYTIFMRRIW